MSAPRLYKTTSAPWHEGQAAYVESEGHRSAYAPPVDESIPDPIVPDGDGWAMVGSAATEERIFWFWRRDNADAAVEADPTGEAMIVREFRQMLARGERLRGLPDDLAEPVAQTFRGEGWTVEILPKTEAIRWTSLYFLGRADRRGSEA